MRPTTARITRISLAAALVAGLAGALPAAAQLEQATGAARRPIDPRKETLIRLSQTITLERLDNRFEDVMDMIASRTGADLDVMYLDQRHAEGFDPEWMVQMPVGTTTALELIERMITRANSDLDPVTAFEWQLTEDGSLQMGPKARLNQTRRTQIYDIHDLLFQIPMFDNAPDFDLSSALQSGSSGGGGNSPIQSGGGQEVDNKDLDERVQELIDLIQATIEPDEWVDLGGTAATITHFQQTLVVTAPDYIHRKIGGYSFWPKRLQNASVANGRRDMSIRPDRSKQP